MILRRKYVLSPLAPLIPYWSTPERAARVITQVRTAESDATGVYYDENGRPTLGATSRRRTSRFCVVELSRLLLDRVIARRPMIASTENEQLVPYVVDIPQSDLDDLRVRLEDVRWPGELPLQVVQRP